MKARRSLLSVAIELRDWEAVSLCLLLGVTSAARALPPEAVEQMIGLLAERRRAGKQAAGDS